MSVRLRVLSVATLATLFLCLFKAKGIYRPSSHGNSRSRTIMFHNTSRGARPLLFRKRLKVELLAVRNRQFRHFVIVRFKTKPIPSMPSIGGIIERRYDY